MDDDFKLFGGFDDRWTNRQTFVNVELLLRLKMELLHLKKGLLYHFCLYEVAKINTIYLSMTIEVPDGEKSMDEAFKSITTTFKMCLLVIFIQSFIIISKNNKCYSILEIIFGALQGGKVKNSGHFKWLFQWQD